MSRSIVINEKTGEEFPKKSRKKLKDIKFFGWRYGDGKKLGAKKGEDFINDGWPFETRHSSVIKRKIQEDISKNEIIENENN
jgi:hypothetical protein